MCLAIRKPRPESLTVTPRRLARRLVIRPLQQASINRPRNRHCDSLGAGVFGRQHDRASTSLKDAGYKERITTPLQA